MPRGRSLSVVAKGLVSDSSNLGIEERFYYCHFKQK